jgi:hypothetical protein
VSATEIETLECIGGPLDGRPFPADPHDPDGFTITVGPHHGDYVRRSYQQAFPDDCYADPLRRLLPDVWLWVPASRLLPGGETS